MKKIVAFNFVNDKHFFEETVAASGLREGHWSVLVFIFEDKRDNKKHCFC